MRQIRYTASDLVSNTTDMIPDAVLSESDINDLKRLAGITESKKIHDDQNDQENISHTAMRRVEYMKRHNIQPGTDDWFALWFSRPYLTGTTGMKK